MPPKYFLKSWRRLRLAALCAAVCGAAWAHLPAQSAGAKGGTVHAGEAVPIESAGTPGAAQQQATFTVNTTEDENTLCNAASCSLREAIAAASPGDEIKFSSLFDTPKTITLQHGELLIDKNLTITGPESLVAVSGNNQSRILRVRTDFTVNISNMVFFNGNGVGGTINGAGGAIFTSGNLTLTRCLLVGNTSSRGGAIFNALDGNLTLVESSVDLNTSTNRGGGISSSSTLTVLRSTISGNTAQGGFTGGGIDASGTLSVINSTISNNRVTNSIGPNGGGIFVLGTDSTATIVNTTVTQNFISDSLSAGGIRNRDGTVTLLNTIVAGNAPPPPPTNNQDAADSAFDSAEPNNQDPPSDVGGEFISHGNNFIGNGGGATGFTNGVNNDQVGGGGNPILSPELESLLNNGGKTKTHALKENSPAKDAGNNCVVDNSCNPPLFQALTTDQRFLSRLVGGRVDIGSFELGGTPPCTYTISPLSFSVPAAGGSRTVNIDTQAGCAWAASENETFISGLNPTSGTGPGTVTFTVDPNTGAARNGVVTVAGQIVTVEQLAQTCSFVVNPTSFNITAAEQSITVEVTTQAGCSWSGKTQETFITGGGDRTGSGSVTFNVFPNSGNPRTGEVTVADQTVTVNQASSCVFDVTPLSVNLSPAQHTLAISVVTETTCTWSGESNDQFIKGGGGAQGTGFFNITVEENTGAARTGTLTVAGQTVTINQGGNQSCSFVADPTSFSVPAAGGKVTVNVTTQPGCFWFALPFNSPFIKGGGDNIGSGSVEFNVEENKGSPRAGRMLVAGQNITVNQASNCTFTVSPTSFNPASLGGPISVSVFTEPPCTWSFASQADFIEGGGERTGSGSVTFTVAPNPGLDRPGTVTVAGQTVTVNQRGLQSCSFVVDPLSFNISAQRQDITVNVTTQTGCGWTATGNASFIFGGGGGIGSGKVSFTVGENATGGARPGTLTVAGQTVTINQAFCAYSLFPPLAEFPAEGGNGSVSVVTDVGCPWEVAAPAETFIQITSPMQGVGPGSVSYRVESAVTFEQTTDLRITGGATHRVELRGCTYPVSPTHLEFPAKGGVRKFTISPDARTCDWSLIGASEDMTVTPDSGTGERIVSVQMPRNTGARRAEAIITRPLGSAVTISQAGKNGDLDFDLDNKADIGTVGTGNSPNSNLADWSATALRSGTPRLESSLEPGTTLNWVINNSANGSRRVAGFGLDGDRIVPGDYNGDGTSDLAVWRPVNATWFIARPTGVPAQNFDATQFGQPTDIPVQADYDGDGITDKAVFSPSTGEWRIMQSTDGQVRVVSFGSSSDRLVPADYDGDGQADVAFWRPADGTWRILQSSDNSTRVVQLGLSGDIPARGDYDDDFKTDPAVFRPSDGVWRILRSSDNIVLEVKFGSAGDVPVPADYDGDLKTDVAVWQPATGTWLIRRSSDSVQQTLQLGGAGDTPIPSALLPQTSSTVQFSAGALNVSEGAGGGGAADLSASGLSNPLSAVANSLPVTVTRTGNLDLPGTVDYATNADASVVACHVSGGAASERCDYTTTLGTLRFAPGEASKTFHIFITDDAYQEGTETFTVTLSNPTGAGVSVGGTSAATVTITDNDTGAAANPIEGSPFFVRLHYVDFLNREAEAAGLSAWLGVLGNCSDVNNNPACDRITVSSSFFRSAEFMLKGLYVIRFYKVSLGASPSYRDFTRDSQRVTGQTDDEVFAFRTAFASEWAQRADFRAIYDALPNQAYVDRLEQTAGVVLANKARLVADLDGGALTRAQVLQQIVESEEVGRRTFNEGFVLIQYFGYLRRDPDAGGFQMWLDHLNQNPQDFRTMVNGFVNSQEYRMRFGRP